MATAYPTIGAPAAYASGFRGDGVRVAVVEYARIDFTRPTLPTVPRAEAARRADGRRPGVPRRRPAPPGRERQPHDARGGDHRGRGRRRTARRGAGRDARPGVHRHARLRQPGDRGARGQGDRVRHHPGRRGRRQPEPVRARRQSYLRTYVDHLVRTYGVFMAVASGNAVYGTCPDGEPVSPATAWNVLTVGGTDDRGHRTSGRRPAVVGERPQRGLHGRPARPVRATGTGASSRRSPRWRATSAWPGTRCRAAPATPRPWSAVRPPRCIATRPALAAQPHVVKAILVAARASIARRSRRAAASPPTARAPGTLMVDWANAIVTGRKGGAR